MLEGGLEMPLRNDYDYQKLNIKIGKILQTTRKSLGYTQEQVAEKLGLGPRFVSDIERDKTKGSIDTLVKFCNIYHVTPTFILQEYLENVDLPFDQSLIGFYNLSEDDKDIIRELIQYMNKRKIN